MAWSGDGREILAGTNNEVGVHVFVWLCVVACVWSLIPLGTGVVAGAFVAGKSKGLSEVAANRSFGGHDNGMGTLVSETNKCVLFYSSNDWQKWRVWVGKWVYRVDAILKPQRGQSLADIPNDLCTSVPLRLAFCAMILCFLCHDFVLSVP